jgi:hypothetical protein
MPTARKPTISKDAAVVDPGSIGHIKFVGSFSSYCHTTTAVKHTAQTLMGQFCQHPDPCPPSPSPNACLQTDIDVSLTHEGRGFWHTGS